MENASHEHRRLLYDTALGFSENDLDDAIDILLEKLDEGQKPEDITNWQEEWSRGRSDAFCKELRKRARVAIYLWTRCPERRMPKKNDVWDSASEE